MLTRENENVSSTAGGWQSTSSTSSDNSQVAALLSQVYRTRSAGKRGGASPRDAGPRCICAAAWGRARSRGPLCANGSCVGTPPVAG